MLIYGKQVFFYYLNKHKDKIQEIYLAKECDKKTFALIQKSGKKITKLDFLKAQALAKGANHQGFLALVDDYEFCDIKELKKAKNIVVLNALSDVGNIGAIVRSAYALGFCGAICCENNVNLSAILRSSAGALADFKLAKSQDIMSVINEFRQLGFNIICANNSENAISHKNMQFKDKNVLILGSEGEGLANKIIKSCDYEVKIKMSNDFDSLNVSNAFAILADRIINGN
ncbi:TrmH family RNA methyltransferase [Campylobacter canadensis]|uniref:RNA methyltransferase n=1 Tax=Campylobacter canadensis TaxID=449520 RepID=A0ABS7WU45_9BACT|nr:RNA methyltransferase [Campylobacter canadensis]MBZ7987444.1 RNA methyltransferase [Campylobacter canadensis]MBZ7995374.1 RNA methyltransferase [Campylobacter canadensis]MBZ7996758.1 RNA methyltransferase [Campylobacter canadensis]MBZ7998639.1 RNA methyltransferase [Campylobacter canadensis]MBZ8000722.1 RNA methyltransferase [Campylobacter canadensis]